MATRQTTFVLGAAVVLGTAWIAFFEPRFETTAQREAASGRVLRLDGADVERIRLRRDHWTAALLERVDTTSFRVAEPREGAADEAEVQKLLSLLEFLAPQATLEGDGKAPERLYDHGLSPPGLQIGLALSSGEELHLGIGNELPGGGVYLHVEGHPDVVVVARDLLETADGLLQRAVEEGR